MYQVYHRTSAYAYARGLRRERERERDPVAIIGNLKIPAFYYSILHLVVVIVVVRHSLEINESTYPSILRLGLRISLPRTCIAARTQTFSTLVRTPGIFERSFFASVCINARVHRREN